MWDHWHISSTLVIKTPYMVRKLLSFFHNLAQSQESGKHETHTSFHWKHCERHILILSISVIISSPNSHIAFYIIQKQACCWPFWCPKHACFYKTCIQTRQKNTKKTKKEKDKKAEQYFYNIRIRHCGTGTHTENLEVSSSSIK